MARKLNPPRKVMGIRLPSTGDVGQLSKQVGEAGKQLGRLASEVNAARAQAQKIGKALS